MSLVTMIILSFALCAHTLMSFMLVAFLGGGMANSPLTSETAIKIIDIFMYALPLSSIICLIILWVAYFKDLGTHYYWWLALPISLSIAFFSLYFIK